MELGKDIVKKIRSAVKSKLLDLGSYVDDELPDYVMVMVANKKSEAQMSQDLSLFLGSKTSKFTSWLHGLLDKLTSITADHLFEEDIQVYGTSKKSGQKLGESRSPNQLRENSLGSSKAVAISEVQEPEITLKSECDYIDDIDKDDDDVVGVEATKKLVQAKSQVGLRSSERPIKKRARETTEKKQKKQHVAKNIEEEGRTHPTNHRSPPEQPIQALKESSKSSAVNDERVDVMEMRETTQNIQTIRPDTLKSIERVNPVMDLGLMGNDNEEHFYPYEISGDVEMVSQDEFNFEENMRQFEGGSELKTNDVVKSRKILVSGRHLGVKPDRRVSVANLMGNAPLFEAPPPIIQPMAVQDSNVTNFIVTLNGAFDHLGDGILDDDLENCDEEEEGRYLNDTDQSSQMEWFSPINNNYTKDTQSSIVIWSGDDDNNDDDEDETNFEEDEDDDNVYRSKRQRISERCRYWPKCKAGEECSYYHPSKPCKTFPNCRYKDKCLFVHPECKFNSSCTNISCPFTHTAPRVIISAPPTVILQPIRVPLIRRLPVIGAHNSKKHKSNLPPSKIQCRFFPNCVDMNCPYSHPKPCRFGLSCGMKNRCPFSHPLLPSKDKLKWFAKIEDEKSSF